MTTRPGDAATQLWRRHRGKRPANLVRIVRRDGVTVAFTDHDRALTFEGVTYAPMLVAGMAAESRESAARTASQELHGVIDDATVLLPDLLGDRYRGAEVYHAIVDWRAPWLVISRHQKLVRFVKWSGSAFVATLEARSQVLTRPVGGAVGGVWSEKCQKVLGTMTGSHPCYAIILPWTVANVEVQTVHNDRMDVQMLSSSWPGPWVDDEYRNGEVEWTTGDNVGFVSPIAQYVHVGARVKLLVPTPFPIAVGDKCTVRVGCDGQFSTCRTKFPSASAWTTNGTTTGSTSSTLTDAAQMMTPDAHIGSHLIIETGTGSNQSRRITDNDATSFTVTPNWTTNPGVGSTYRVHVNNGANFGGNPLEPSASQIMEPAE